MNILGPISRRSFLVASSTAAALAASSATAEPPRRTWRAAIIGRTGGGDYGHGFETVFTGLEGVSVEAVADTDPAGRQKAADRSGAKRQYADYREMLEKERPDLVSIAPRHPDCHRDMALAAIETGAHCIIEKPFTEHLDDADAIVDAARTRSVKIAVGHKNRYSPDFARIKHLIDEGFLGTVLDIRIQGKQDHRSGGEDLIVLGTHDFDTMRYFFGDPLWCFASVTANGKRITKTDIRKGREPMLVAGDTIRATFQFPNNISCSWQSVRAEDAWHTAPPRTERWGFHIFGTKRILAYYSLSGPFYLDSPFLGHKTQTADWKPLPQTGDGSPPPVGDLARDLIHAIENDGKPRCDAIDGRWTIEMVSSIYASELAKAPVQFPLENRENPLLRF